MAQAKKRMPLYVALTMDCERIAPESLLKGPKTWEFSEKTIRGFCEMLLEKNMKPTLFLIPETAQNHRRMLLDLASEGIEMATHMHPQAFLDHRYSDHLGNYNAEKQKEILGQATSIITEALAIKRTSFRAGHFSHNDETFGVLSELGYTQGSVSGPGRELPIYGSVWKNAFPWAHFANSENRLIPGDLPFLEIPVTHNPHRFFSHYDVVRSIYNDFPYELRIEERGKFKDYHLPLINEALDKMASEKVEFRTLCLYTHNYIDYSNARSEDSMILGELLRYLEGLQDQYDVVTTTLTDINDRFTAKR